MMQEIIRRSMLAREFGASIRGWLDPRQLALANERNAYGNPAVCHTHDFCDANMAMLEAFARLMGREQIAEDDDMAGAEADLALINAAWAIAKSRRFWGDPQEAGFWQWRATMQPVDDLGQQLGDAGLEGVPGLLYEGGYIECRIINEDTVAAWERGGPMARNLTAYYLLISRDDWASNDLEALERILFFEWVLPEGYLADLAADDPAPGVNR